jgi:NADPH:quinone reductase-like Zn-dependent oxidoreductase
MKTITYNRWGGPDVLQVSEASLGPLAENSVRINVEWAGVNPADGKVLSGKYKLLCRGGFPRRIGLEGAGRIQAVGRAVTGLAPGMAVVFGLSPLDGSTGAWAEQLDVNAKRVLPVPDGIALRASAGLPIAALTAWLMCRLAAVEPGKDILISGASGGVGHFAVQIAKSLGAKVSAMGSQSNRAMLEKLGADDFIDYAKAPPQASGRQWDGILDCVNVLRAHSLILLRTGGHYIDTDPRPMTMLGDRFQNLFSSRRRRTVAVDIQAVGMAALFDLVASGKIKPVITREYPLTQAADALRQSQTGHVAGKLVLKIGA